LNYVFGIPVVISGFKKKLNHKLNFKTEKMIKNKRKYESMSQGLDILQENGDFKLKKLKTSLLPRNAVLDSVFTKEIIDGDGNCLFRAILFSLIKDDSDYKPFREILCDYIIKNKDKYSVFFEKGQEGLLSEMDEMKKDKTWGTNLELYAASEMLKFNFEVYYTNNLASRHSCIHSEKFPTIYLEYVNGNHFNSLSPIESPQFSAQKDRKKLLFKLLKPVKKSKKEQKNTESLHSFKSQALKSNLIKIDLPKKAKAHRIDYPTAKNNNDTYNEVYKYLTAKIIPTRFHPLDQHKKTFENWKKDIQKNYKIDKVSMNISSSSRLRFTKSNKEEVIIPFQDEINKIIEQQHTGFCQNVKKHFGYKITKQNIIQCGIYWAKMSFDIQNYIKVCPDCIENKYEPPIKEKKAILPKKPLERIQGDLIKLHDDLIEACGRKYKFVFSCVDHFSKYKWCYAIEDKTSSTIIQCFQNVIATFGPPSIFQTDNGKEFRNKDLEEFLRINKIKFINGSVRHPQSQGLVERHNRELKDYLEKAFRVFKLGKNKNEEWKLQLELENFRVRENNRSHIITKYKPNEIINSKDKALIETVKCNIQNHAQNEARKNKEIIIETLKKNTKAFIVKNVIPNRNHTKLEKAPETKLSKKIKIKIPALIIKDYNQTDFVVKIQVMATVQENLKLENTYNINPNYLSLPDEVSWNTIVEKITNKS